MLIPETIHTVSAYARSNENEATQQMRQETEAELNVLIKKLYEAFATGKLTEKRLELLSREYDREQAGLDAAIEQAQADWTLSTRIRPKPDSSSRYRSS